MTVKRADPDQDNGESDVNKASLFFANPDRFSALDAASVGKMISTSSDVSFVVSNDGQIHDISIGDETIGPELLEQWAGAKLQDLVTEDSRHKVLELLADAAAGDTPHWREVNHIMPNGEQLPVRYSAVSTGPGMIVLLGRDLRAVARLQNRLVKAQLALEQDYERFRQIETRYRVLFETSSEALIIMDAESGRIIEANPTAAKALGRSSRDLVNAVFEQEFADESHHEITATLASVRATGKATNLTIRGRDGGSLYDLSCVLFRAATETFVLCRLTQQQKQGNDGFGFGEALGALFNQTSDAVVITDHAGQIHQANDAFLSLADVAVFEGVRGTSLSQFLGRPGVDLSVMLANAQEHGRLSIYSTTLRSTFGSTVPVEISAVHIQSDAHTGFGFILRDVSRLEASRVRAQTVSPESVEHVMELVGSAPLKELVRSTTDVVERMCIETALQLTGNNRASAAEMLGLSRQSLYVKLRKFGLINSNAQEEDV
ncbi:MAG: transcriptional regulator PpsR [Pseudomonadota bacterium]